MRYEIESGGRIRQVTVNRAGGGFAVSVDDRLYHLDVVRMDAHTLSLIVDNGVSAVPQERAGRGPAASGARTVYTTTFAADAGTGRLIVQVGAVPVAVTVNGRRQRRSGAAPAAGSGPLRIVAPMPGKVVRVLINAGDEVRAGQPVVVIEAMKMENELRTSRPGTVSEVHILEGVSVDAGALLVVIA